ncbi:MAG: RsmB/NOP family class I SAM-dependent RNA methyltransferase [Rubellimicrobium sp.]|nr:RsmB/NOP family class I SAM-dependent RNA methyltransferase [Rubellimicrobium sp.]
MTQEKPPPAPSSLRKYSGGRPRRGRGAAPPETHARTPDPLAPRRAALALLHAVMAEHRALSDDAPALTRLPPEERARARRLAADTLRGLSRADRVLAPHLARRPPLAVLNVLRLAVTEIAHGEAAHGAVGAAVDLVAADRRHRSLKALVNAVLRKAAPETAALWPGLPPPRLPGWLRKPLLRAHGAEAVAAIEAVHALPPPLDLTARDDPQALAQATGGTLLPGGSVRLHGPVQVSALPGYEAGTFWVQDAAAALPARVLAPAPGERILDLCAAPGGKTLQLAAAGADVTAVDLSESRLARLYANLARTGLTARVVAADALAFTESGWDAILLDAPCSATGTIRRHPELPHIRDAATLPDLVALQARLIDHALGLLAPGGRLVYATCSLLPEEGEQRIAAALARHPGLRLAPARAKGLPDGACNPDGSLRLRPDLWADRGGMDGFFIARLERA